MIDLYTFLTPNGRKVSIALEELALEYKAHVVDIMKGDQFKPDFLKITPNNKIPAIVDSSGPDGQPLTLFESGAILIYLAEKTDSPLLPKAPAERYQTLQWLMFQMGGVGPMFGQNHHFRRSAPEAIDYAINRFAQETERLYGVMDKHLQNKDYFVSSAYTIADIAIYPWVDRHEWQKIDLDDYPNLARWYDELSERPAIRKGMAVPNLKK